MTVSGEPLAFIVSAAQERGGMRLPIMGPAFTIGREATNNLCVMDDPAISRQHCIIHVVGSSLMIEDFSKNGTFVNGERVLGMAPLPVPSTVRLGRSVEFAILENEPDAENATSVIDTSQLSDMGSSIVPRTSYLKVHTDAYLVVDVVNSTLMVQREEGHYFAKLMLAMGRALERSMRAEVQPFLKSTGDGFFACFGTAGAALKASLDLVPTLARQMPVDAQISIALHWGPSNLTDKNDRIGNNVHAVFSVEQIRHQDPALEKEIQSQSTELLLLMTEAFWDELDNGQQALAQPLGTYKLKGLDTPSRIYRWRGPVVGSASS